MTAHDAEDADERIQSLVCVLCVICGQCCSELELSHQGIAQKIPSVALEIEKHRNAAVGFPARRGYEGDPRGDHSLVRRIEIVDTKEQAYSPRELIADYRALAVAVGAGEEYAR